MEPPLPPLPPSPPIVCARTPLWFPLTQLTQESDRHGPAVDAGTAVAAVANQGGDRRPLPPFDPVEMPKTATGGLIALAPPTVTVGATTWTVTGGPEFPDGPAPDGDVWPATQAAV